jgi:hypothetical protein
MTDDRSDAASPDPGKEAYWTPLMAVVWIVYRDMNEVRKVWSGFVKDRRDFNFERNPRYVVSPNEAVAELWRLLESGELIATGIFQGLRRIIQRWEWCDLKPIDWKNPRRFFYGRQYPRTIYIGRPQLLFDEVRLPAKDVLRFFPSKDVVTSRKVRLPEAAPPTEKARLRRKLSKVEAISAALPQLFLEGRSSMTNDEIGKKLKDARPGLGGFSPRTLSRALSKAWPSVERGGAKR